jgi:ferredoxin
VTDGPDFSLADVAREGLIERPGAEPANHDGTGRVDLAFTIHTVAEGGAEAPPTTRGVRVPPGVTVFDAASWNGIAIDSTCGGHGTCHKCKVRVEGGDVPITRHDVRTFSSEQIGAGWRLGCLVQATANLAVEVPALTTRPKAATVGIGRQVILRPALQKRYVELTEATLADQRTDLVRLTDAIEDLELTADLHVLRRLSTVLREADFKVTAVIIDEALIDVEAGDTTAARYAIAFDLGTTTVVGTLLDVGTGTPLAVTSMLNRQQPFGGDVITRISATMMDKDALGRLQDLAGATLSDLSANVCREAGVDPAQVYEVAVAGNATMTALALGIDPEPLGVAPFVMSTEQPPSVLASEIGLTLHPRARAYFFPALGAYVGGDIVAGMLATGMDRDKRARLFIDVGTNCEIVLSDGETILSTAAPAGPAFEGGAIRCGMRAADGAIEVIKVDPHALGDDPAIILGVIGDVSHGACAVPAWSTRSPSWSASACSTRPAARPRRGRQGDRPGAGRPNVEDREERVFVLHRPHSRRRARRVRLPLAARRPRAPVRQGGHLDGLVTPARAARPRAPRRAAGAARRVVRQLSLARFGCADRARPEAPRAADRGSRQRGRGGRQDGAALGAGAGGRPRPSRGGDLCRALRSPRFQRQVRRAALVLRLRSRLLGRPSSHAGRSLSRRWRWSPAGAGRSTCTRSHRSCTTVPSRSPARCASWRSGLPRRTRR